MNRDFRLLELILPFLRGTFKDAVVQNASTVRLLEFHPLLDIQPTQCGDKSDHRVFFADAHAFLSGPLHRKAILVTLFTSHLWHQSSMGPVYAISLLPISAALARISCQPQYRPTFRQAFQLRRLFEIGVSNLLLEPRIFLPVSEFIKDEHEPLE